MSNIFALAGLLHDIGKFGQRADLGLNKSTALTEEAKANSDYLCNISKDGFYTHQHVIWTDDFIQTNQSIFEKANLWKFENESLSRISAAHHKPTTFKEAVITLADHWSSGFDRNSEEKIKEGSNRGKDKFKSIPLVSIFNELKVNGRIDSIGSKKAYNLLPLGITEKLFPKDYNEVDLKPQYNKQWKLFIEEFSKINSNDSSNFIYSAYHILKKYTWNIPASTIDYPNCSLFEHMKITGALAHCFADYFYENKDSYKYKSGNKERIEVNENHFPVLMLCGDISGIQGFIYNITNKMAMKSLKGRSFYVQLLAETISDELLQRCGVTIVNQVYAAGGKFYMLLPNTEKVKNAIAKYQEEIQKKLWNEYEGKLSVNFATIAFSMKQTERNKPLYAQLENTNELLPVGELWYKLVSKASEYRKIKFNDILKSNFDAMFFAHGKGGDTNVCAVTGNEISKRSEVLSSKEFGEQNDGSDILVDESIVKHVKLGAELYDANYLISHRKYNDGFQIGLNTSYDFVKNVNEGEHSINKWINIQFNDNPQLFPNKQLENNVGLGFKFYGGLPMPSSGKKIKTLEELCLDDNGKNTSKLGVLRMDVDNLGSIFQVGFESEHASFSKLATLSALLEQFFSGYINTIRNSNKYINHVAIIYSGGDDVFAVGRWDKLLEFGIEIRNAFRKFVCDRDDITLSAGISIVGAKFPISKAAELSGEAESSAKSNSYKLGENEFSKDSLNLFDINVNWTYEMPFVQDFKSDLIKWIRDDNIITKGLLMKIFDFYHSYKNSKLDWRWNSAYTFARYEKECKYESAKKIFNDFKNLLYTGKYKDYTNISFDAIIVACRWAELELKLT